MVYLILFYEFFKTGLFSIGGGLATLPFLMSMAERYPYFSEADLMDMIAISESTPGPIGINMATYAGYKAGGILGSVVSTTALVLPAFVIIILIYKFMERFKETDAVRNAFYGIRPATAGLIASALYAVMRISLFDLNGSFAVNVPATVFYVLLLTGISIFDRVHPIVFIVIGAAAGLLYGF